MASETKYDDKNSIKTLYLLTTRDTFDKDEDKIKIQ